MIETQLSLQLILDGAHDGAFNMALDEDLFRKQIQNQNPQIILRFYRFRKPTLTVGYGMWRRANRSLGNESLIQRLTGGGIVVHTPADLTYSLIVPLLAHPMLGKAKDSYFLIHQALKNSLQSFHVNAELYQNRHSVSSQEKISYCFNSPVLHDVMLGGEKIAGAGQKRSFGYLLHQGSIAWTEVLCANSSLVEREFCDRFANQLRNVILSEAPAKIRGGSAEQFDGKDPDWDSSPDRPSGTGRSSGRPPLNQPAAFGLRMTV